MPSFLHPSHDLSRGSASPSSSLHLICRVSAEVTRGFGVGQDEGWPGVPNEQVGTFEVGTFEVGTFEVGAFEVGAFEVGTLEVGALEEGVEREGLSKIAEFPLSGLTAKTK